ncbi:DUF3054 domain-containing protein [Rhodococcoides trifolii]|uniref:DUF3054 domain-containing protein n=1 Tax=Rhodococcoides trifolii TaxID=908250 RepID=UPI00166C5638|nr:DUF3054 domain-containing protein [Rhodococcus trifolii]
MNRTAFALAVDVVVVLVFCLIGRSSHAEGLTFGGIVGTAWPFLVGLAVGWLATIALYRNKFDALRLVPTGVLVWVSTVVVGMVLRVVSGQGTEVSFIVVASVFTALFLLGWRSVARFVLRRQSSTAR